MSATGDVRRGPSSRDDWETPDNLFQLLHDEFLFTLDAAANATNAKLATYLGPGGLLDNAFSLPAPFDESVWVNPPYGRDLSRWIRLFQQWATEGSTVVALLPANTDTAWFRLVWDAAAEIRFLQGRVQFIGSTSSNPGGSMIAVFRRKRPNPIPAVSLWDWKAELE